MFAVTFSTVGVALALLAPLLFTLLLFVVARLCPPALRAPGAASGMGGALLLVLFVLACEAVISLFRLGRDAGEVASVIAMEASYAWPALQTLIPEALKAFGVVAALLLLTVGRSPRALRWAIGFLWLAGPAADLLRAPFLGIPFDFSKGFMGVSAVTVLVTLYLLFSRRSNLTYGTASGRRTVRMLGGEP